MKCFFLILMLLIFHLPNLNAQEWGESYDPNTEVSLKGKLSATLISKKGPVILEVTRNDRNFTVITAPFWFLQQEGIELRVGDEVIIQGAKYFSRNGEMFIIARSIHNLTNGQKYNLRDEELKPNWKGKGKGKKHRDEMGIDRRGIF
ncbi:hypothetical protein [Thermodesulfovibrio sp.]|uniref:hypothetical protein n=1 Tax=Thermodesulfovibrio sp. TaxID=2067987 RepID=UPI00309CE4C7